MRTNATKLTGRDFDALMEEFVAPAPSGPFDMSADGVLLGMAEDSEDDASAVSPVAP
jgi:hypothetical protein